MREDQSIQDETGVAIEVGTRILFGDTDYGVVYDISDWDADYSDAEERGVLYCPEIRVRFDDGTEEVSASRHLSTSWVEPGIADGMVFEATDLVAAPTKEPA